MIDGFRHLNIGRCTSCGRRHAINAEGLCMACKFVEVMTEAYPKTESYQRPDGVIVLDLSRVTLRKGDASGN